MRLKKITGQKLSGDFLFWFCPAGVSLHIAFDIRDVRFGRLPDIKAASS